jgi:hypothetical protein
VIVSGALGGVAEAVSAAEDHRTFTPGTTTAPNEAMDLGELDVLVSGRAARAELSIGMIVLATEELGIVGALDEGMLFCTDAEGFRNARETLV